MIIALSLFYFLFFVVFLSLMISGIFYVPFVPTQSAVMKKMIAAANLKDGQKVYDLGCGDGRLLMEAMKQKNIVAKGVEINIFISCLARLRIWLRGQKAEIIRKNFFKIPLGDSNVIFCYLFPKVMQRLGEKFDRELKPGTTIISYCFPIKHWKPQKTIQTRADKPRNFLIYVYQFPCPLKQAR